MAAPAAPNSSDDESDGLHSDVESEQELEKESIPKAIASDLMKLLDRYSFELIEVDMNDDQAASHVTELQANLEWLQASVGKNEEPRARSRLEIAALLSSICFLDRTTLDEESVYQDQPPFPFDDENPKPWDSITAVDWDVLRTEFIDLERMLARKHCDDWGHHAQGRDRKAQKRAQMVLNEGLEELVAACDVQRCRWMLQSIVERTKTRRSKARSASPKRRLEDEIVEVCTLDAHNLIHQYSPAEEGGPWDRLARAFLPAKKRVSSRSSKKAADLSFELDSADKIQEILENDVFSIVYFKELVQETLQKWNREVLSPPFAIEARSDKEAELPVLVVAEPQVESPARKSSSRRQEQPSHDEEEKEKERVDDVETKQQPKQKKISNVSFPEPLEDSDQTSDEASRKEQEEGHGSEEQQISQLSTATTDLLSPERLTQAMTKLRDNHRQGPDPLAKAQRIADAAIPGRAKARQTKSPQSSSSSSSSPTPPKRSKRLTRPRPSQQKKQLDFSDSSVDEASQEEEDRKPRAKKRLHMSTPPLSLTKTKNIRPRSSTSTAYTPASRKRRRFTEEEKEAIRTGVEQIGVGKWAEIKKRFRSELRQRTSVQIKDCFRTMMKREGF